MDLRPGSLSSSIVIRREPSSRTTLQGCNGGVADGYRRRAQPTARLISANDMRQCDRNRSNNRELLWCPAAIPLPLVLGRRGGVADIASVTPLLFTILAAR